MPSSRVNIELHHFPIPTIFAAAIAPSASTHLGLADHLTKGGVDGAELDVGVDDGRVGAVLLDISGHTGRGLAFATGDSRNRGVLVGGVGGVEPQHVGRVVIPQRHDQNHTGGKSLGHASMATLLIVRVAVVEHGLLLLAEIGRQRVSGQPFDGRLRVGDDLVVLDVEALDVHALAGAVELGHDGEFLGCVDRLSLSVEGLVAHAVGVEIAAVSVARAGVTVGSVGPTAGVERAFGLSDGRACVGSVGCGNRICFPDCEE